MDREEIEALGTSLRRINQKLLKPGETQQRSRIWYQGGEPYFDFFVEVEGEEVVWFQLTLRGRSISCNKQTSRLKTGSTNELSDDVSFYPASKTIQTDRTPDADFVDIARAMFQLRAGEDIFDQVLAMLDALD